MRAVTEPSQEVPVVAEVDVAVVGGGTAGIGAALGAARAGARTLLVEAHGSLGGQMTLGQVNMIPGDWDYEVGSPTYGGVMTELVTRLRQEEAYWPRERLTKEFKRFDIEVCKWVAIDLLEAAGVQMRLHSWASNAIVKDGRIEAVMLDSVAGRQAVVARSFVDTSGDAMLAHFAGASYETGTMGISLEGTAFMPDLSAFQTFVEGLGQPFHEWLRAHGQPVHIGGSVNERTPQLMHISRTLPDPGLMSGDIDGLDVAVLTQVENQCRRDLKEALDFLRARVPGCRNMILVDTRPHLGVRSTRRVVGDYAVTREDMTQRTRFDDCVVRSGTPDGYYEIPYRALYSRDLANLWVAGRCFSSTHEAQTGLRIIPTCVATGEAAGTAAALAAKQGCTARDLETDALVSQLVKQGVALREETARLP